MSVFWTELPNDRRGIFHKRILGAAVGFLAGGPSAAVVGFARGGGGGRRAARPSAPVLHSEFAGIGLGTLGPISAQGTPRARRAFEEIQFRKTGTVPTASALAVPSIPGVGCILPWRRAPDGSCKIFLGDQPGRDDTPVGDAVMGRYGAGLQPGVEVINRSVCLPGMVLGDDGICYNKGQVPNKRRMWPRGRKPLLTGGEMNAITTAARAARRVKATTKKLQSLGMLERPKAARKARAPESKVVIVDHHDHH